MVRRSDPRPITPLAPTKTVTAVPGRPQQILAALTLPLKAAFQGSLKPENSGINAEYIWGQDTMPCWRTPRTPRVCASGFSRTRHAHSGHERADEMSATGDRAAVVTGHRLRLCCLRLYVNIVSGCTSTGAVLFKKCRNSG